MPIYEFACLCGSRVECIRKMGDFAPGGCPECGREMEYVVSVPALHIWNADEKYPNITKEGDGTKKFDNKREYKKYLTDHHLVEADELEPIERSHGADVTVYK